MAAVPVGVVAIVVSAWAAFRSANPRRCLHVVDSMTVSLLQSAPGLGEAVEVCGHGRPLVHPYIITVDVVARSGRDIQKSAFVGPLSLDFGVSVVALLHR
jgi:hypothetical protein